jgi:predicted nucleic acid-binding protein
MFLLDTMLLSEMRKKERNSGVTSWLSDKIDHELFVSVISIGEIARGIALQMKKDIAFAKRLQQWLDKILLLYNDRILPVDIPSAKKWGELSAMAHQSGSDVLLAATAIVHNLTIVTRNEKHFVSFEVRTLNPWT